jgi:ketosteroid isomerase-like protein
MVEGSGEQRCSKVCLFLFRNGIGDAVQNAHRNRQSKIQEVWTQLMAKPGFSLRFAPTQVEVAKSKDMAYDIGTFELKLNDAQGAPMTIPGKYVVVWKKQKGGGWKAEADIFNTDK